MPRLLRESDGAGDIGSCSQAIKYDKDGLFESVVSHRPIVGCCMLVGSSIARTYSHQDYWLTTEVLEIIEEREDYVKFRTNNSIYEWFA